MATLFSSFCRIFARPKASPIAHGRSIDPNFTIFREGDRVVVNGKNPLLTKPLGRNKKTNVRRGTLEHNDIIGKKVRDVVRAHKGPEYRITQPTLEDYVSLTPRLVTPVYPADANLIVSLLDIHTTVPSSAGETEDHAPLEILESGTGQGSLTLHLARAINGANTSPPPIPQNSQRQFVSQDPPRESATPDNQVNKGEDKPTEQETWDAWRAQRRAILHTVEISPKVSAHAENIVRGFKRGVYAGSVDFYVSSVEDWVQNQTQLRSKSTLSLTLQKQQIQPDPFLSYAILDMPSAHLRIPKIAPILKTDGILAVFMPNITQIGDCVEIIRDQRLPFTLDKAVELGTGISSGRLWDVRTAVLRSKRKPTSDPVKEKETTVSVSEDETKTETESTGDDMSDIVEEQAASPTEEGEEPEAAKSVLVCRPKVGTRIVGGGFVGIWRKMK